MRAFHETWAWVMIAANLGVGVWGLVLLVRRSGAPRGFWPAVLVAQAMVAVQVVAGVILTRTVEANRRHMFYGFVVLTAAILSWAFRGDSVRRAIGVATAVSIFVGAVSIRGAFTA